METKVLLIGAGSSRKLTLQRDLSDNPDITTLDIEASHNPDVLWDLNNVPWPFEDNSFDQIHAYEVLEHLGQQGDARSFFGTFAEAYRILKPGGYLVGSVPGWDTLWAWGDPSHKRIICEGSFTYLDYTQYAKQVGVTPMTDFRSIWQGDFETVHLQRAGDILFFALKCHKPRRP